MSSIACCGATQCHSVQSQPTAASVAALEGSGCITSDPSAHLSARLLLARPLAVGLVAREDPREGPALVLPEAEGLIHDARRALHVQLRTDLKIDGGPSRLTELRSILIDV